MLLCIIIFLDILQSSTTPVLQSQSQTTSALINQQPTLQNSQLLTQSSQNFSYSSMAPQHINTTIPNDANKQIISPPVSIPPASVVPSSSSTTTTNTSTTTAETIENSHTSISPSPTPISAPFTSEAIQSSSIASDTQPPVKSYTGK